MVTETDHVDRYLSVTVTTSRMVHGTQFKRICKAAEHLYYLLLLSSLPAYQGSSDVWNSWLAVGTDLAVRTPPWAVRRKDRYVDSVHSLPREISIVARGNGCGLESLCRALRAVEVVRAGVAAPDRETRTEKAFADAAVREVLVHPLESALRAAEPANQGAGRFAAVLAQSVASLMVDDITGVTAAVGPLGVRTS